MATSRSPPPPAAALAFALLCISSAGGASFSCPELGSIMDCGKRKLTEVPTGLPPWVQTLRLDSNLISHLPGDAFAGLTDLEELILSNNRLKYVNTTAICRLPRLRVLKLTKNFLSQIPDLSSCRSLKELYLNSNNISMINAVSALSGLVSLNILDLSRNPLEKLGANIFPVDCGVKQLNLADSGVETIDAAAFAALGGSLEKLRLGRNKLTALPRGLFAGNRRIEELDLSRNRFRHIEHTTFKDLSSLRNLTLRRNEIELLRDGSFFECKQLETLNLEENKLTALRVGSFFGLQSLKELFLAGNNISSIDIQVWEQAKLVTTLDLSKNSLRRLGNGALSGLRILKRLLLGSNGLQAIDDHALDNLERLETLDLSGNHLSDMLQRPAQSVFSRLTQLSSLDLSSNAINSVSRKLFQGLSQLRQLALRDNPITTVEQGAFDDLRQLIAFELNSAKLVCDCKLGWLPAWLKTASFVSSVSGTCLEPSALRGRRILDLPSSEFACEASEQSLQPVLTRWPPATVSALRHSGKTLSCEATVSRRASSDVALDDGSQPTTVQWIKDGQVIQTGKDEVQQQTEVHRSVSGAARYISQLLLSNVTDDDEGHYQCSFANEFGHAFSPKVEFQVLVYPQFTVLPASVVAKAEQDVSLKCAATGQPPPEISVQKDGGVNFPSARDRRFSFNQETNEFIIKRTRAEDAGIYYCVARNDAGANVANATVSIIEPPRFTTAAGPECPRSELGNAVVLTCPVEGSPTPDIVWFHNGALVESALRRTLSARSSKLILEDVRPSDAGAYTCVAANLLGKVEGSCHLRLFAAGAGLLDEPTLPEASGGADELPDGVAQRLDSTTITGIVVIAAVCGVVGTSLVWVAIIYYMRHRRLRRQRAIGGQGRDVGGSSSSSSSASGGGSTSSGARTDETMLAAPERPAGGTPPPTSKSQCLYVTGGATWQLDASAPVEPQAELARCCDRRALPAQQPQPHERTTAMPPARGLRGPARAGGIDGHCDWSELGPLPSTTTTNALGLGAGPQAPVGLTHSSGAQWRCGGGGNNVAAAASACAIPCTPPTATASDSEGQSLGGSHGSRTRHQATPPPEPLCLVTVPGPCSGSPTRNRWQPPPA